MPQPTAPRAGAAGVADALAAGTPLERAPAATPSGVRLQHADLAMYRRKAITT
jgi:hypothetical protein